MSKQTIYFKNQEEVIQYYGSIDNIPSNHLVIIEEDGSLYTTSNNSSNSNGKISVQRGYITGYEPDPDPDPEPDDPIEGFYPLTFEILTAGKITFTYGWTPRSDADRLWYRKNYGQWYIIYNTNVEEGISVETGDFLQFRANRNTFATLNEYGSATRVSKFGVSNGCTFKIWGYISSLLDNTGEEYTLSNSNRGVFAALFEDNTGLIDASNLVLCNGTAEYCYYYMFKGCTNLIGAPDLWAEELSNGCYFHMFEGCTSLISAPALPATELATSCYASMFSGCTSLTASPRLIAIDLADRCYTSMFYGCSSLSYIECYAPSLDGYTYPTLDWVYGVADEGIFKKSWRAEWPAGKDGIPSGWTVIEV